MKKSINYVHGTTISNSQPGVKINTSSIDLATETYKLFDKKSSSILEIPEKKKDSHQEKYDVLALEQAENEGMTR